MRGVASASAVALAAHLGHHFAGCELALDVARRERRELRRGLPPLKSR